VRGAGPATERVEPSPLRESFRQAVQLPEGETETVAGRKCSPAVRGLPCAEVALEWDGLTPLFGVARHGVPLQSQGGVEPPPSKGAARNFTSAAAAAPSPTSQAAWARSTQALALVPAARYHPWPR